MAKAKIGIKGKSYRNSGTYGSPTWSEVTVISDLQVGSSWQTAKSTIRASRINTKVPTTLDLSVTGKLRNDDDDTNFIALLAAYHGPTAVDMLVLDGGNSTDGSQGYRGYWYLTKFDLPQGLDDAQFFDFELSPDNATQQMKTAAVASSTLAYAAIAP